MRTNIADADSPALLDAFTAAKDYRDSITITAKGALKNVYELYLDLIDETGGIATVATILASNNLSIKNIGIIHNREFEGGVLRLEMYDGESLALAVALLKKHHYTIYERQKKRRMVRFRMTVRRFSALCKTAKAHTPDNQKAVSRR